MGKSDADGRASRRGKAMVDWFAPGQLAAVARDAAISEILKARVDFRMSEAVAFPQKTFDYGADATEEDFWFDYVADVGDGWSSTFAVALALAAPALALEAPPAGGRRDAHATSRGRLLVMGGDQTYPVASHEEYAERLRGPYDAALPREKDPVGDVFAIPGNHDWYDGLGSFSDVFCRKQRFGAWQTRQDRSYFALRLPRSWWLFAVDLQLRGDLDPLQLAYFRDVADGKAGAPRLGDADRVILCLPEPIWIPLGRKHHRLPPNLAELEAHVRERTKRPIPLWLAGDLHHYRHHEVKRRGEASVHLVVAGGGGAFLHPTHGPSAHDLRFDVTGEGPVALGTPVDYPTRKESWRIGLRNLYFPFTNLSFGALTAVLYMILAWVMPHEGFHELPWVASSLPAVAWQGLQELAAKPGAATWALFVMGVTTLFAMQESALWWRLLGGPLHGLAHLFAALLLGWTFDSLALEALHLGHHSLARFFLSSTAMGLSGYLVGSVLMGLYLLVALNLFGQHPNEAFSALRFEGYKNFLRLRIDRRGRLTIFPVKITHVPDTRSGPLPTAKDVPSLLRPALIEDPISIAVAAAEEDPEPRALLARAGRE